MFQSIAVPKKTMLICLIAVLSLALMGFGFAKWSDTVTVAGTVNTGNVETVIGCVGVNDPGADPQQAPGVNNEGKDVGSITCTPATDGKSITVAIENGYPYYQPGFTFAVTSTGTIPVKIESILLDGWTGDLADDIEFAGWQFTVNNPAANGLSANSYTVASDSTNCNFDGLVSAIGNAQLHENGTLTCSVNLYIEQSAEELSNASATFSINSAQWNEVGVSQS